MPRPHALSETSILKLNSLLLVGLTHLLRQSVYVDLQKWQQTVSSGIKSKSQVMLRRILPHHLYMFLFPSYREGTPRTVLEAMAMGRPVVHGSDVPGCRETV